MTVAAWYTVGTLLVWAGLVFAFRSAWFGLKLLARVPDLQQGDAKRIAGFSAGLAGLLLLAGLTILHRLRGPMDARWHLPLVWWIMPFSAWLALISSLLGVVQAVVALGTHEAKQQQRSIRNLVVCIALAALGIWAFRSDHEAVIKPLTGSIPMDPLTAVALLLVAIGALAAVAFLSKAAQSSRIAKGVATQAALLAGSILFGLPMLYLLITSFKEDRDMSSPNGIVWIPRVQRTVPYKDPANPLYAATYNGQSIQATIAKRAGDSVTLDVVKPFSLRGLAVETTVDKLTEIPKEVPLVSFRLYGQPATGMVVENLEDGQERVRVLTPAEAKGKELLMLPTDVQPIRDVGPRWQNYSEALSFLPPETSYGLAFVRNTLVIAILSVIGTVLSSSLAAYAFARMRFPGREALFAMFLATMMLPGAVTLLPQFLIFRRLGWIDTQLPLWVPAFFGSAFNIFMLRQFFRTVPMELEDAARIDGCGYGQTFWRVMLPQIKPALAVISIWTFLGAWNNFMGPLIYINSIEKAPISYALQLYMGDRSNEPGLLMAFATMSILPILLLFFFAQRYFIEGVTLSGLGGK